jgi:undecaprenyl phosphate-alpha-L-ara4N flippase subunit ArnE
MIKLVLLMTVQSALLVTSQVLLRTGLTRLSLLADVTFGAKLALIATNLWLISSVLFIGLSGVVWITVLKEYEFSVAYPLISISYILALVASKLFFAESITGNKLAGVAFIVVAVILITRR